MRTDDSRSGRPRVSVIVPNYNHAPYLGRRLRSVLGQSFGDFEVILLDDASTDDSLEVIAGFEADPRVRVVPNETNTGNTFRQWNKGAALARGEYLWFAESDDDADPRLLERLVGMLDMHPNCGMACCESWYLVDDETPPTRRTNESHKPENARWRLDYVADGPTECAEQLIRCNTMPNASAVVIRRCHYDRAGGADESMRLCGDWLLWAKILAGSDLAHVGEPLNFYRCQHESVRSRNYASPRSMAETYRVIAHIAGHVDVPPEVLERELAARAARFARFSWERGFSARDAWTVYREASRVDPRARSRIALRWLRLRVGSARLRLRRAVSNGTAPGG